MNATTACLCIITWSLVSVGVATQVQATSASGSGSAGSAAGETHEKRKPVTPGTANPNGTTRGMPPAGKPRQVPVPPDRTQAVEERLRSGQMEKPIAQGEISDRLNQLHSGSNSLTGETAAEHSSQ